VTAYIIVHNIYHATITSTFIIRKSEIVKFTFRMISVFLKYSSVFLLRYLSSIVTSQMNLLGRLAYSVMNLSKNVDIYCIVSPMQKVILQTYSVASLCETVCGQYNIVETSDFI
jgi:hypothetical protein